jgi:hypothetical protein
VLISDFLQQHPPQDQARVRTGAWNVANTSGYDFSQWAGSDSQRRAIETIFGVSRRYWQLKARAAGLPEASASDLEQARRLILEGETSCFLFWGDDWIPELYKRTAAAETLMGTIEQALGY